MFIEISQITIMKGNAAVKLIDEEASIVNAMHMKTMAVTLIPTVNTTK
jgi:hypothetical protein